jgi:SAM-dependent methyltransferase
MSAAAATGVLPVAALRRALAAAGYDEPRIREALRLRGRFVGPGARKRELHLRRVGDAGSFSTLVRLFLLDAPVARDAAADALAPLALDDAARLGLVRLDEDTVEPRVRIAPHDGLLIVSDGGCWRDGAAESDVVLGLSDAAVTLARLTPRDPVERALDIGTGAGLQALLAARHAQRVVATDVNPRALEYTRLNADLNGLGNIELRQGSLFEPVAGETFDLVVSNPPFVVGPDRRYVFRDGGPGFSERVLRGAANALAGDGSAISTVSWSHDGDAFSAPRAWLAGCAAVVLHLGDLDLLTHGWTWTDDAKDAERWARALREQGATAVGYGVVALRRGGRHVTEVRYTRADVPAAGAHMARMLRNASWLGRRPSIDGAAIAPAADLELRRVEQLGECTEPERPPKLALRRGLPLTLPAHAHVLAALRRGVADGTPEVRRLLEFGFAVPQEEV